MSVVDLLPLSVLRRVILVVAECLQRYRPNTQLFTLKDWHEHDGYVTSSRATLWSEVLAGLATEEALYAGRTGDTSVSVALFPEERDFYFRFQVLDEDEEADNYPGRWGRFDVTCSGALVDAVVAAVAEVGGGTVVKEPAKQYFDEGYGG